MIIFEFDASRLYVWVFSQRSVLFPTDWTVEVHKLCISHLPQVLYKHVQGLFYCCRLKNAELRLKDVPEATVKPWRESHFPGCHSNIPAPHYSIIPEHRDISLSDVEGVRERGRGEREAETSHAFWHFLITIHTTPKILNNASDSDQDSAVCFSKSNFT